mgnify:CR=1 FL=1
MCIACLGVFVVCLVVFCVYGLYCVVLHAWVMAAVILYDCCESCICLVYVLCVACVDGCVLGCVCCMHLSVLVHVCCMICAYLCCVYHDWCVCVFGV